MSAAAILVAAAAVLAIIMTSGLFLVLTDVDTGEEYASFPMENGDRFSVEFIHSVNNSPVTDVYELRNGADIFVVETDYYGFGAGVQTQLNPGEVLEYAEDGAMQIKNIDTHIPRLIYVVGTVSDHTLRIDDKTVSLRELCGRNSRVEFTVERRLFGRLKC